MKFQILEKQRLKSCILKVVLCWIFQSHLIFFHLNYVLGGRENKQISYAEKSGTLIKHWHQCKTFEKCFS